MSFEKFCAKCGKTTEALINGLCSDCYLKRHELFEVKDVLIEQCVKCGKAKIKGRWAGISNEIIAAEVASRVKLAHGIDQPKILVELTPITEFDYSAKITVEGIISGTVISQSKPFEFSIMKVSCDSCMKLASNYREAIIQLRASPMSEVEAMYEVTKELFRQEASKDSLAAIIKTLKGKPGYDLWIGSKKGAHRVVRKLEKLYHTNAVISKKLIGVADGGADKFRVTYCIKTNRK